MRYCKYSSRRSGTRRYSTGTVRLFQAVKGGGHGDYHLIVLAPNSVQELAHLTAEAFNISDEYRIPTMILGDGTLGQMMEPVDLDAIPEPIYADKPWAARGTDNKRKKNIVETLYLEGVRT